MAPRCLPRTNQQCPRCQARYKIVRLKSEIGAAYPMLECRVCQNRWRRHFEVFSCRATAASEAPTDKDTAPSKLGRKRGGWSHRGRNYFEGAACAIPIRRSRTVSHQGHLSAVKGSARVKTTMLLRHGGTPSLAIEQRRRCHRRSPIAFAHEPTYVSHSNHLSARRRCCRGPTSRV